MRRFGLACAGFLILNVCSTACSDDGGDANGADDLPGGGGEVDAAAGAADASPLPTMPIAIAGDGNRDGTVTLADLEGRGAWRWQGPGAFLLANLDDDDGDGKIDAEDDAVNGARDGDDLALLRIWLAPETLAAATTVALELGAGGEHVRVFAAAGSPAAEMTFSLEARRFADAAWNGRVTVRVVARDAQGAELARDETVLRVAPWIMLPSAAATERIYVAQGVYANSAFLRDLGDVAEDLGIPLHPPFQTKRWQEMWMQDTMEIGYTQLPGGAPMHVVLRANRDADAFPRTLLGADFGYLTIGAFRGLGGGDDWADWYGNLEATGPVPGWPLGRVYYGRNTTSGATMHPAVVAFAEAQEVQGPFWIDTSWLTIKHVDEIMNVVRGSDGEWRLIVASPRSAGVFDPVEYGPYNKAQQAKLDKMMNGGSYTIGGQTVSHPGVKALLGLGDGDVIELPVLYTDGHNDWSSPVNALFLNGTLVTGASDLPPAARQMIETRLGAVGVPVRFVDDRVYQVNLGNVHCATNAKKTPLVSAFWAALPALD